MPLWESRPSPWYGSSIPSTRLVGGPGKSPPEYVLPDFDMHRAHLKRPDVPRTQPLAERGIERRHERRGEASNRRKGIGRSGTCRL